MELAFGFTFAFLIILIIYNHFATLAAKRRRSYEWYLQQYPDAFKRGRVHCHVCDGNRLSVQKLMNHTYLRAHVCSQCGTTLYYSKE